MLSKKSINDFKSIGINVMKDNKNMKTISEIMDELAIKWKNLNPIQKSYFAERIGGIKDKNKYHSLLDNYDKYKKLSRI